ncbi:SDR family oxidoreductase [Pseudoalteromonas piscicida]|uniref:dTDP-4-dehydrorhamnose reductase n=1 Tax=Pseudoalteromonas piscicida TaxID=43662 RepID=A0A2A5JJJ1_PSEO7|nr:sugar nucleotide-binding protein [Pseudoalteromonas piscicida]PCK29614.1 hypothetical protein CEX98_21885 [Pseudoalteromonas piscicida]
MRRTLIIGGDSNIGRYFREQHKEVAFTSRRSNAELFLDLSDPNSFEGVFKTIKEKKISSVIFLAAITKIADCENKPERSHKLNVENTCILIKELHNLGCFTVFISTNHIFDCKSPKMAVNSPKKPFSIYGQHKLEVEEYIIQHCLNVAILRPTKILTPCFSLVNAMLRDLKNGIQFEAFDDHFFSPVSINFFCDCLTEILLSKKTGVYQISGENDLSYYTFLREVAIINNLDPKLVIPIKAESKQVIAANYGSLKPKWFNDSMSGTQSALETVKLFYNG